MFLRLAVVAEDYSQKGEAFARQLLKADRGNPELPKDNPNLEEAFAEAEKLALQIRNIPVGKGKGCRDCGGAIQNTASKDSDSENGILVFVSFSMPHAALKILSDQAEKHNAKLILRGVVDGSFRKTGEVLRQIPINCEMLVHPELFGKYGIKKVPTFVKVKNGEEIDRLSGNVDLDFVLEKFNGEK
jgi:type-F conjugative transfer system pilin assembly protein TrbC